MNRFIILAASIICLTNSVYANSMSCPGKMGSITVDDSEQQVVISGKRAIQLSNLLLEEENVYVNKVQMTLNNGKIVQENHISIARIKSELVSNSQAVIEFVDGTKKLVKIDGGFLSASFNPYYGIGIRGSLTLLKGGSYVRVNLHITLEECINLYP